MGATVPPEPPAITLGLLAGGRGTRLGGVAKAWLERDGQPQVLRLARRFGGGLAGLLVSADRDAARLARHGLAVVADRHPGLGPLSGLDALAAACRTPWLLTLPVDLVDADDGLPRRLGAAAAADGAFAIDDDGPQPLVALWRTAALRAAAAAAIAAGGASVQSLQARLDMAGLRLPGVRFGNLNTPGDLAAHGFQLPRT